MERLTLLKNISFTKYRNQKGYSVIIYPGAMGICGGSIVKTLQHGERIEDKFILSIINSIIFFTINEIEYELVIRKNESAIIEFDLISGNKIYDSFTLMKNNS